MNEKVLLIRLSALGDVIFALPALSEVHSRHPGAEVTWLVEDKASTLLMHRPDLKRVIVYPRARLRETARSPLGWPAFLKIAWRHLRALRSERFDAVYDLQGNLKSGVHARLSRGRRKVGFSASHVKEGNALFTNEHVTPPPHARHRIEKSFSLIRPDFRPEEIPRPDLHLSNEVRAEARASIEEVLLLPGRLLVVHPGTSAFGAYKRWAPEKFGRLARRMADERGFKTLVTWGPGERELAEAVAAEGGRTVHVAPPTASLPSDLHEAVGSR